MTTNILFGQDNLATQEKLAMLAREQFDRGTMFVENAESNEDFKKAITEFKNSLDISMYGGIYLELRSSIYYNLGLLYYKIDDYGKASVNLLMYLSCKPAPEDSAEVKEMFDQIDNKLVQFSDPKTLEGIWYYSVPREISDPRLEIKIINGVLEARCLTSEASQG